MAQFDINSLSFVFSSASQTKSELSIEIDNPQQFVLDGSPSLGAVPADVEVVPTGQEPTQALWVYAADHHLTITLDNSTSGGDPLNVQNTGLFNTGDDAEYVDIIIAEKDGDGKKTKKIRRKAVIVSL